MTRTSPPIERLNDILASGCKRTIPRRAQKDPQVHVIFTKETVDEMQRLVTQLGAPQRE